MKRMYILPVIFIAILLAWCSAAAIYVNAAHHVAQAQRPQQNKKSEAVLSDPIPLSVTDKVATIPAKLKDSVIAQGNKQRREIALTFDDGPYPYYTAQILAILQHYQVHATFFCLGKNIQNYPLLVQQEYATGSAIGNHTWDHPDLTKLSNVQIQREITSTSLIIQKTIGMIPTIFRPPYGAINIGVRSQIARLQLTPILWSVDTEDWQRPGPNAIINTALTRASSGGIILMHDGGGNRAQTVAALPYVIEGLKQRGYDFVTVPQLISNKKIGNK